MNTQATEKEKRCFKTYIMIYVQTILMSYNSIEKKNSIKQRNFVLYFSKNKYMKMYSTSIFINNCKLISQGRLH